MVEFKTMPRPLRRLMALTTNGLFVTALLVDLKHARGLGDGFGWLIAPGAGLVAVALLVYPVTRLPLDSRAWLAGGGSLALTAVLLVSGQGQGWALLETISLLFFLPETCRWTARPAAAVVLGLAAIAAPVRLGFDPRSLGISFAVTFAVGMGAGIGCYLRVLDSSRARSVAAVRQAERLELARDLHDFVAHHVTGIVVQVNAARAVRETAPEQVDVILDTIQKAGMDTLDSMRRLVRVLRETDSEEQRPGEILTELDQLVSAFSETGEQEATLIVAASARTTRLAPEVESSAFRVVQEALTNVRRHAPGAAVAVHVNVEGSRLRVAVHNGRPAAQPSQPAGGSGGFGLVGLRERVAVVDGTLEAGATPDGGWRVTATFPTVVVPKSTRSAWR